MTADNADDFEALSEEFRVAAAKAAAARRAHESGDPVSADALRVYQRLQRIQTPGMYEDQDLRPVTHATLPSEGPRYGSLPLDEVSPREEHENREDRSSDEEYRLPPAPELRRPAVSPTPRPTEPYRP